MVLVGGTVVVVVVVETVVVVEPCRGLVVVVVETLGDVVEVDTGGNVVSGGVLEIVVGV